MLQVLAQFHPCHSSRASSHDLWARKQNIPSHHTGWSTRMPIRGYNMLEIILVSPRNLCDHYHRKSTNIVILWDPGALKEIVYNHEIFTTVSNQFISLSNQNMIPWDIKYYKMSNHIISCQLISYHIVSYHITLYHLTLSQIISPQFISSQIFLSHLVSSHLISCHPTTCHVISSHLISIYLSIYLGECPSTVSRLQKVILYMSNCL